MTTTNKTTLSLLLFYLLNATRLAAEPSAQPQPGCSDELLLLSPCLDYVTAPPNNLTSTPNTQCCDAFASAFTSGVGICICYLIWQPMILGFPLDDSRVLSLSPICTQMNSDLVSSSAISLYSLCSSGAPEAPPLRSISNPDVGKPVDYNPPIGAASASYLAPDFAPDSGESSMGETISLPPSVKSSTERISCRNYCMVPGILFLLKTIGM